MTEKPSEKTPDVPETPGTGKEPNIPDISEVDFDTRLKVLLGVPPVSPTESDPDK